jgi:TnpA family transposase
VGSASANSYVRIHIRYDGYGGIGYYLVSDNYIALMSRFTTCGSWEGHYILDFLQENKSEVQPDTIHADTQGQSTAIFGLAYLLGIELMPRINICFGQRRTFPTNISTSYFRRRWIGI